MRLLLGSLACCVLVGGAGAQTNVTIVYPPPEPQPSVVILRERPPAAPAEYQETSAPARQITYLIAFKNDVVRLAAQYWVKGNTLYYVSADHQEKSMPLDSVDRALSQRLNSEQNVTFFLPAGQKSIVATRQIRNTTISAHQQCCCASTASSGKASRVGSAARGSR